MNLYRQLILFQVLSKHRATPVRLEGHIQLPSAYLELFLYFIPEQDVELDSFSANFTEAARMPEDPYGGTSTPCSSLVEEHVIFGGEKKLANLMSQQQNL